MSNKPLLAYGPAKLRLIISLYAPRGRKLFPEPAYTALLCRKKTSEQSEQAYAVPYEPPEQTYAPFFRKLPSDPVISITQPSPSDGDGAMHYKDSYIPIHQLNGKGAARLVDQTPSSMYYY